MKDKLLISFSGGETSAFMAQWLIKNVNDKFEIVTVFSNTGEELEETLEFVEKCDKYFGLNVVWVEGVTDKRHGNGIKSKIVNFKTANRTGKPFEAMIQKHGIPNISTPHCTRELKSYTINHYVHKILKWNNFTALGYRADEVDRMSPSWKKKKHIYPLIFSDYCPMTKPAINRFWRDMPFRLPLKGYEDNCKCCWKKSLRKLITIAKHHPERFDNFRKWEKKYENYIPESRQHNESIKTPIRFFRGNLSCDDIIKMSKEPFEEAPDERMVFKEYVQTELFGHQLDVAGGKCGDESCEPFSED